MAAWIFTDAILAGRPIQVFNNGKMRRDFTFIDDIVAGNITGAYDMLHMAAHQTQEIMDPLAAAIVAQFPEKFVAGAAPMMSSGMAVPALSTAPLDGPMAARDGRSLAGESAGTRAMFGAVWGPGAAVEWVQEHNLMIGR